MELAKAIRQRIVEDLGIGLIKHLPYILGTLPVLKHTLNREWRNSTEQSFFSTSIGIPSTPHALPNFASSMAFFTSIIKYWNRSIVRIVCIPIINYICVNFDIIQTLEIRLPLIKNRTEQKFYYT